MITFLWVVFGGAFFVAVTWAWYRFGYRNGWNACVVKYDAMKKDIDPKKNAAETGERQPPLQLIANRNDSIMQIIASGNDGVFYALNIRKSVR